MNFPRRLGVMVLSASALVVMAPTSSAAVPTGTPVFTNPTNFTNEWLPIVPGSVSMFRGKSGGKDLAVARLFLADTRMFSWNGGSVECQLVKDVTFKKGKPVGVEKHWFAEADNGSTYYFGVIAEILEDGAVVSNAGSWLVGGPQAGDPPAIETATDPTIFALSQPEVGDTFKPQDVGPGIDETVEIKKEVNKVKTEAGKFKDVIQTRVFEGPDLEPKGKKFYAKGVGEILTKSGDTKLELIATSFLPKTG